VLAQRDAEIRALRQEIVANKDEHNAAAARLNDDKSTLEKLLGAANNTVESHAARIDDLEKWVAERDRLLAQRDAEIRALHQEIAANKDEHNAAAERLNDDKSTLEKLLGIANNTVESHVARIDDLEKWVVERDRLLAQRDAEATALHQDMAAARDAHNVVLERLLADKSSLERLLQNANHTLETRAARIEDLEKWAAERDEVVRQRDAEIKALFQEIAAVKDENAAAAEALRAEKADLESQLQNALEHRSQAQIDLTALKHEAEATWRAERVENALLRERINDIAAQVAHMALAMDKSGPIEAILTESASIRPEAFERRPDGAAAAPSSGNLTERIRKLQNGASRVPTTS